MEGAVAEETDCRLQERVPTQVAVTSAAIGQTDGCMS